MKIYLVLDDGLYGYQKPVIAFTSEAAAKEFIDMRKCYGEVVEIELVEEEK